MTIMRCPARRKDGAPCTGRALSSGYCFAHDPALQARRDEGKRRGGEHRRTAHRIERLTPVSLRPVLEHLLDAMKRVDKGEMGPSQATALAALAGAVCRVYDVAEMESRLRALEGAGDARHAG